MNHSAEIGVAPGRVVVVGNGPVGQTGALLLARWGVRVILLDARAERDLVGSRSICQQRDVVDIWESAGAGARIAAEGVTWTTARNFYRDQEIFGYTLPDPGRSPFPPFVNISQSRTEQILDECIAAQPLIDVRWGHEVTGLVQDDHAITLTCRTGTGAEDITADYAVICAGARGDALRAMLGVTFDGESFTDRFLICDIRAELPGWATERRFYFDPTWNPGRQVLIHPCPGSTYRIDWQVPGDHDLAAEEESGLLDRRVRQIIGPRPYDIVWKTVYRFHSRVAGRMRVGRALLAGDCAHVVAPFGARGLNTGVCDAENAAWKLAYVLRGWAGEELLESYHDERHAAALENLEVTTATMDFLVPRTAERRRRRHDILSRAATDPQAAAQVDSGRLAEPFWYAGSPLTTPDEGRPFAGRPPRGTVPPAGPGIIVPDVPIALAGTPCTRFRELARDGFLLLAGLGVGTEAVRRAAATVASGPVRVLSLAEIDASGLLAEALAARPGEVWVIRPDAHVAAVLAAPDPGLISGALHRAHGRANPREPDQNTREAVDNGVLPQSR